MMEAERESDNPVSVQVAAPSLFGFKPFSCPCFRPCGALKHFNFSGRGGETNREHSSLIDS